jgi:hypothetical protein
MHSFIFGVGDSMNSIWSRNRGQSRTLITCGIVVLCLGLINYLGPLSSHLVSVSQTNGASQVVSPRSPFAAVGVTGNDTQAYGPDSSYHWYAGGVYEGANQTATIVETQITVPGGAAPKSDQFYYVILSVFDNTGSYDQLGFANNKGFWGLAYSYTTGSCTSLTYHYSSDALKLTPGATYKFVISIAATGNLYFRAYLNGTLVYGLHYHNGAEYFSLAARYCGHYDYTVYEEAYMLTAGAVPNHSFTFSSNYFSSNAGSTYYPATWTVASFAVHPPQVVRVTVSGSKCYIKN